MPTPHYKTLPEDFMVIEHLNLPLSAVPSNYRYYTLTKKNWESFALFTAISTSAHILLKDIGYAGLKDKRAVTTQHLSIPSTHGNKLDNLHINNAAFTFLGYGKERITIGSLNSNTFDIVVRNIPDKKELRLATIPNYFDQQRFGSTTISIGKALTHHHFKEACELLELTTTHNDYIGALRTTPLQKLRFYINSYQSWLWNTAIRNLKNPPPQVPLLGYLTTYPTKEVKQTYERLLKKEGIELNNFLMPQIPELSAEGNMRNVATTATNFAATWGKDELHPSQWKCTLHFTLPKGSYATLIVKHLFPTAKDQSL